MAHQILEPVCGKTERCHLEAVRALAAGIPGQFGLEDMVNPFLDFVQLGFAPGVPDVVAQFVERLQLALGSAVGPGKTPGCHEDGDQ